MSAIGYLYILTNANNNVLYCGATDDMYRRVQEHKNKTFTNSFIAKYKLEKLVYFESFSNISDAFKREKQIKGDPRKKKTELIESINTERKDLFETLQSGSVEEIIRIKKFFR
ncbi:MAG: GIY-YIG nuclease family protein [Chitinophagaceae bacterium]